jgi:hypothetical protein
MTREKCCASIRDAMPRDNAMLPTPDQLSDVTGCRTAACNITRFGMRLMVCLALLCAVAACGSQRDRTPIGTPDVALADAMMLEKVPPSWNDSLRFMMGKESGGRIGIQNPGSSARGLFQLTAANHHLNPNGAASFGNGVEQAQGGIRYIKQRYGTADQAMEHWLQYQWY